MRKLSYVDEVYHQLKTKGSITSWESIEKFGNTRLSATIFVLRHTYGMDIKSVWMYSRKWWKPWKRTRFVKYILEKGE